MSAIVKINSEICFNIRLQFRRPVSSLQASGEAAATNKKEFEEYYALADFAAEDTSQVTFKTGDKVLVKTKDESGE